MMRWTRRILYSLYAYLTLLPCAGKAMHTDHNELVFGFRVLAAFVSVALAACELNLLCE